MRAAPIPVPLGLSVALEQRGGLVLAQLAAVLVTFLLLAGLRAPLVFVVRVLFAAMCRADAYASRLAAPSIPASSREEASHA